MIPLLLVAGGFAAGYLLLRPTEAAAATSRAPSAPPDVVPIVVLGEPAPVIPAPAGRPLPAPPPVQAPPVKSPPFVPEKVTGPAPVYRDETPQIVLGGRWLWPVPKWQGRAAVISDGYGSRRPGTIHRGVDIMFARISTDPFPIGSPNGSPLHVMPDNWPAVAASDGVLESADLSPRGYQVVIDHGGGIKTYYQHLSALFVPLTKRAKPGTPRDQLRSIRAGQPLGVIGGDPTNKPHLKHLHFELWPAGPASAIDPARLMRLWHVTTPSDLAPFMMLRNARGSSEDDEKRRRLAAQGIVWVKGHERFFPGAALKPPPR